MYFVFLCFYENEINITNKKKKYLPANTTSILKPLDQGIILAMKQKYCKTQFQYIVTQMERSKEKDCS